MTDREFSAWLSFHSARFPNWASWLAKMPQDQSKEVTKAMFEVLADRSLEDCKMASKRLAAGDEPEIDQFDQHPRTVRAIAKRLSGERIKTTGEKLTLNTKERTFSCKRCWDATVPLVTVFHQQTVEDAKDVQKAQEIVARKRQVYRTSVACDCDRGREHGRVANVKVFNDRMLLIENNLFWQQRLEELVEWANREDQHAWSAGD